MKILIVRFSSIGDIVLTTPVIRCLKDQIDCELHYLTKEEYSSLLTSNPHIKKVYTIRKDLSEVESSLRKEKYDLIVDLHHNLRSFLLKRHLRRPYRSFPKLNFEKWLKTALKINKLPKKHIVDRYMETVRHLGIENDGLGLDHYIPASEEVELSNISNLLESGDYIAIAIGAKFKTKKYPISKYKELLENVKEPIVLLGGESDREDGELIREVNPNLIFSTCGKLNLHGSASIIKNSRILLTNDTGMMHIGCALGKEVIALWGNTIPEFGMYPYYGNRKDLSLNIEVAGLSCRPCSKIGYNQCPKGHFKCMNDLDQSSILMALREGISNH